MQFASLEEAIEARKTLNGLSIFPDCCGLVINYSKLPVRSHARMNCIWQSF